MAITLLPPSPNGEITHLNVREKVNEVALAVNEVELGNVPQAQFVYTKPLGGLRFLDEASGYEYFVNRRDVAGQALGAVFGNLDSPDGNYLATSEEGGFNVCHKTDVDLVQTIGNLTSSNYIEGTVFSFVVTSEEVKPYGIQVLNFVGGTDVDFSNIGFDTRILDATGTVVYSDIQQREAFLSDPSASPFRISSVGGVVTLPASQPFPMDSSTPYTVEYTFASPVRLQGDGAQPALLMQGKRLEYYPVNYTGEVGFYTSDFIALTNAEYKVDASGGAIIVDVHPTVKSFWIGDEDETWTDTNTVTLRTESADLVFGTAERKKSWHIIKKGTNYLIYKANGDLHRITPV